MVNKKNKHKDTLAICIYLYGAVTDRIPAQSALPNDHRYQKTDLLKSSSRVSVGKLKIRPSTIHQRNKLLDTDHNKYISYHYSVVRRDHHRAVSIVIASHTLRQCNALPIRVTTQTCSPRKANGPFVRIFILQGHISFDNLDQ